MFLQACVIHSVQQGGGGGYNTKGLWTTPASSPPGLCAGGRYTSYLNAFLFKRSTLGIDHLVVNLRNGIFVTYCQNVKFRKNMKFPSTYPRQFVSCKCPINPGLLKTTNPLTSVITIQFKKKQCLSFLQNKLWNTPIIKII